MQKNVVSIVAIVVVVVCLAVAGPVAAQSQSVHGQVQSVQGSQLTVKADDGRVLTVDMSAVAQNIQQALTPGMGVTISGSQGASATQMTAQYIQQDSSDTSRGGTIVGQPPAASTPPSGDWQKVHGTVQSVSGTTLTLKADDGRVLTVDMSAVAQNIQQALSQGMGVTLAGSAGAGPNQFTAQYIQQDSSANQPAASPTTK
jgi:preprotein translocase subunit YajC